MSDSWRVIYGPRVAKRDAPSTTGTLKGAVTKGAILNAVRRSPDQNWIELSDGAWVMIKHPDLGTLLDPVAPVPSLPINEPWVEAESKSEQKKQNGLKKEFEMKLTRKACGANLKSIDADGASRDSLFDHLVVQELLEDFRLNFRMEGIPEEMYNTDLTSTQECTIWCQMGGQIGPIPSKKSKTPTNGPRQRVERLGGLRCIISEIEGVEPGVVAVLGHGINVLGDDLFGLAHHARKGGVRFVLPEAPYEVKDHLPGSIRQPRQWWQGGIDQWEEGLAEGAAAFSACAGAAIAGAPSGARLAVGGFSQGAAVALQAACGGELAVHALLQLSAQAPKAELGQDALQGTRVFVAAGDEDEVAPLAMGEALLAACAGSGAVCNPLFKYSGEHEVTLEVADAVKAFIEAL